MTSEPQRFLCDASLQRIARWLRAAGHDTLISNTANVDYALLRQAIDDDRLLITRNKLLTEHRRAKDHVILIDAKTLHNCARELSQQIKLEWQCRPFSRCLVCNTPLLITSQQQLPHTTKKIRTVHDSGHYCPNCRQVFWSTGQFKRMRNQLRQWHTSFTQHDDPVQKQPHTPAIEVYARKY